MTQQMTRVHEHYSSATKQKSEQKSGCRTQAENDISLCLLFQGLIMTCQCPIERHSIIYAAALHKLGQ
jgi:hypothetical protein